MRRRGPLFIEDIVQPYPLGRRIPLSSGYPEVAVYWCYPKNCGWGPDDFSIGSNAQAWWVCANDPRHIFQLSIVERVHAERDGSKVHGCSFCRGFRAAESNSLANFPELCREWMTKKNGKTPDKVVAGSHRKAWWRCTECKTQWQAVIKNRTSGWETGCPACGSKIATEWNNLAVVRPDLAEQWHPKLNGTLKPSDVLPHSAKAVWWQCAKNKRHIWPARVQNRTSNDSGCPLCYGRRISLRSVTDQVNDS
jgi:DNA-directed RNA polymerase subunit RPC12/RpoP